MLWGKLDQEPSVAWNLLSHIEEEEILNHIVGEEGSHFHLPIWRLLEEKFPNKIPCEKIPLAEIRSAEFRRYLIHSEKCSFTQCLQRRRPWEYSDCAYLLSLTEFEPFMKGACVLEWLHCILEYFTHWTIHDSIEEVEKWFDLFPRHRCDWWEAAYIENQQVMNTPGEELLYALMHDNRSLFFMLLGRCSRVLI